MCRIWFEFCRHFGCVNGNFFGFTVFCFVTENFVILLYFSSYIKTRGIHIMY